LSSTVSPLEACREPLPQSANRRLFTPRVCAVICRWHLPLVQSWKLVLGIHDRCSTRSRAVSLFLHTSTLSRKPTYTGVYRTMSITNSRRRSRMASPPKPLGHRRAAGFEHRVNNDAQCWACPQLACIHGTSTCTPEALEIDRHLQTIQNKKQLSA